jgi:hypothetical protein
MSGRNEEWEKNLEVDDLQWKTVEGQGILKDLLGHGLANARNPLKLGRAIFAYRSVAAYLNRNAKNGTKPGQWLDDLCDRAEAIQLTLSNPTNARDDVLTAHVFTQWNENAKSKPNIDISAIPEAVTKTKG